MLQRPALRRAARFRPRRLLRHPIPWWIAAVLLAITTTTLVGRLTADATAERARWGHDVPAVVALADHDVGDALRVEVRLLPRAVVPEDALTAVPPGGRAVVALAAGEVVLARRVAPDGLSLVAARLPSGTRGIAVPHGVAPLPVEVGDVVDVLASYEADTDVVATGALVVAVDEDAVTVAVDERDAAAVAYAVNAAAVTLALSGTSLPR
jgi:Flp pilus assembly protein CpaB